MRKFRANVGSGSLAGSSALLRNLFFNKELELSIIGLQNAGKTTFVNVLANNRFDEDTIPTIGFNYKSLKKGKVQFKLWDLGK